MVTVTLFKTNPFEFSVILNMAFNLKKSCNFSIKILTYVGIWWTPKINPLIFKVYSSVIYVIFLLYVPLSTIANILLRYNDIKTIADSSYVVLQLAGVPVRIIPLLRYVHIKKCLDHLDCPEFNIIEDEDRDTVEEVMNKSVNLGKMYIMMITVALLGFLGQFYFFENEKEFLFDMWLPFESTETVSKVANVIGAIAISIGAYINGSIDALIIAFFYNAITQIKILKRKAESLAQFTSKYEGIQKDVILYRRIAVCVKHYDAIINYVKLMEKSLFIPILAQLTISSIVICMAVFMLTLVRPLSVEFFSILIFNGCLLAQIYLYCYFGTDVYFQSSKLIEAIYLGEWWSYDLKSKKALLVLMERAKVPLKVSIAGFFDVSLETFSTILKRAYSFFAIMQRMNS